LAVALDRRVVYGIGVLMAMVAIVRTVMSPGTAVSPKPETVSSCIHGTLLNRRMVSEDRAIGEIGIARAKTVARRSGASRYGLGFHDDHYREQRPGNVRPDWRSAIRRVEKRGLDTAR
jgi:hypothetical protein